MQPQHKNRVALITGASRGFGLAIARGLATAGWQLILTARDAKRLVRVRAELSEQTVVVALAGDIAAADHRADLAVQARSHGGLDAVVNNAGALGPSPLPQLLDHPIEMLRQVYEVNVLAPLALLQAVRRELKPGARVINVTSDAGVNPCAGWGGYGSSKAALEHISAVLALENPGLRVYRLDPGEMRTAMHQAAYPSEDISDRPLPDEVVPAVLALLEGDFRSGRHVARELLSRTAGAS